MSNFMSNVKIKYKLATFVNMIMEIFYKLRLFWTLWKVFKNANCQWRFLYFGKNYATSKWMLSKFFLWCSIERLMKFVLVNDIKFHFPVINQKNIENNEISSWLSISLCNWVTWNWHPVSRYSESSKHR